MDEARDLSLDGILRRIEEIAPGLHTAGTFSARVLEAIADAARKREIRHSAETGSGASTLLFSHLSQQHTVFALDDGSGSVNNVRRSPLLTPGVVTFVEGPTQVTLPQHRFSHKLQLALIDGPHAYPFPDLEYYYLYPHLEAGALLIVDDIQIRTVHNLFEFLRSDIMFRLERVVGSTAFFARTEAPAFDQFGDGWWLQNYNVRTLAWYEWKEKSGRVLREVSRAQGKAGASCGVEIDAPRHGAVVEETGQVEGRAEMAADTYLWVLARRKDFAGWWPQAAGPARVEANRWTVTATYGGPQDAGREFEIAALAVGETTHQLWMDWVARVQETGEFPPVQLPPRRFILGAAYRTVRKTGIR